MYAISSKWNGVLMYMIILINKWVDGLVGKKNTKKTATA